MNRAKKSPAKPKVLKSPDSPSPRLLSPLADRLVAGVVLIYLARLAYFKIPKLQYYLIWSPFLVAVWLVLNLFFCCALLGMVKTKSWGFGQMTLATGLMLLAELAGLLLSLTVHHRATIDFDPWGRAEAAAFWILIFAYSGLRWVEIRSRSNEPEVKNKPSSKAKKAR